LRIGPNTASQSLVAATARYPPNCLATELGWAGREAAQDWLIGAVGSLGPRRGDPGAVRQDAAESDAGGDPGGGRPVGQVVHPEPGARRDQDHVARGRVFGPAVHAGLDGPAEHV